MKESKIRSGLIVFVRRQQDVVNTVFMEAKVTNNGCYAHPGIVTGKVGNFYIIMGITGNPPCRSRKLAIKDTRHKRSEISDKWIHTTNSMSKPSFILLDAFQICEAVDLSPFMNRYSSGVALDKRHDPKLFNPEAYRKVYALGVLCSGFDTGEARFNDQTVNEATDNKMMDEGNEDLHREGTTPSTEEIGYGIKGEKVLVAEVVDDEVLIAEIMTSAVHEREAEEGLDRKSAVLGHVQSDTNTYGRII